MILSNDKPDKVLRLWTKRRTLENPLLDQLKTWLDGLPSGAKARTATKFSPAFRTSSVAAQTRRGVAGKINPFLRAEQVDEVARRITTFFHKKNLIENNRQVLQFLLENTTQSRRITTQAKPARR